MPLMPIVVVACATPSDGNSKSEVVFVLVSFEVVFPEVSSVVNSDVSCDGIAEVATDKTLDVGEDFDV